MNIVIEIISTELIYQTNHNANRCLLIPFILISCMFSGYMHFLCIHVNYVLWPYFYKILLLFLSIQLVIWVLLLCNVYMCCKKDTTHTHEDLSNFLFTILNLISRKNQFRKQALLIIYIVGCVLFADWEVYFSLELHYGENLLPPAGSM